MIYVAIVCCVPMYFGTSLHICQFTLVCFVCQYCNVFVCVWVSCVVRGFFRASGPHITIGKCGFQRVVCQVCLMGLALQGGAIVIVESRVADLVWRISFCRPHFVDLMLRAFATCVLRISVSGTRLADLVWRTNTCGIIHTL